MAPVSRLGDKVRRMRLQRGLTLAQLAALTKVSTVTIHNIERNVYEPKISTLLDLCRALDAPLDYFLKPGTHGLFIRVSSAQDHSGVDPAPHAPLALPRLQRVELDEGREIQFPAAEGTMVMVHAVFGRLEAKSGDRTLEISPGDTLFAELFDRVTLLARETSLVVVITHPTAKSAAGS